MADLDIAKDSGAGGRTGDQGASGQGPGGDAPVGSGTYQSPRLTPIGNLHDLLAGGGSQCDVDGSVGNGGDPGSC